MDFVLTEEQTMIQKMAKDFAEKELKPIAKDLDKEKRHPGEIIKKMADLSLMGMTVPVEYGGGGVDYVSYALAVEEISRCCAGTGTIMSAHNSLACFPIMTFGSDEQKRKYLVPLAEGRVLGCFGLTEPEAGSDAGNQKTIAILEKDEWVINGRKVFITNGNVARYCVLAARTKKDVGYKGISCFIVDMETPGAAVGVVEEKLGICCSGTAELIFEDCRIPRENVLGEEGAGYRQMLTTLDAGRIGVAAQAVGIARAGLEESIKFAQERVQFGKRIADFQGIQWMIADMATEIDAARCLVLRAASMKDQGLKYEKESAMAKLFASEVAMRTTTKALQIHGGYGYIKEYPVERHFRDAKITEIYEGTSEIQRIVIARSVIGG
jgi:alkylation response protein AidB-like acyl-CoA dehydrogenase